jgi:energy-coupling factor transporter ATP-binding protein EcfA2
MLSDHVSIAGRFQRSVRIDTDLARPDALQGFICQRSASDALLNMAKQVVATKQRAFTWTGPYGGGKSSLAVALAGLLGPKSEIRSAAAAALGASTASRLLDSLQPTRAGWLVVPVVGRRGNAVADIGDALEEARRRGAEKRGRPRREIRGGRELISRLTQEASARPRDGVLLVIDELGKYLESAAADGKDIFFFQELAEAASRAQGRLVIVGILHQAFEQYANRLGREARDEWAKIQGRYVDVPIIAGVDEVIELLGRAITADRKHPETGAEAEKVAQSIRSRRPGTAVNLGERLDLCWPLHPVTAAILGPMSRRRFGQNERSIFSFLTSAEPGGFQEFLRASPAKSGVLFGPDRFWDYLRINLEPAILASNDSHRWAQGVDAVERCEGRGTSLHITLAKSIAAIEMFRNGSGLAADRVTLGTCVPSSATATVDSALRDLERWSIAVFRKHNDAWAVYAGSDFDIDSAVKSALAQAGALEVSRLTRLAGLQPVLAKRHYRETGTLRWFQTELVALEELEVAIGRAPHAAGHFVLALPSHEGSRKAALSACSAASLKTGTELVAVGLPRNASRIREFGSELTGLEMVRTSRPELEGDGVARREIAARIAAISASLEEELREGFANADWYLAGERLELPLGGNLSALASKLADHRYNKAPHIESELLNRQRPSSNTQAGVRDLMHAMVRAESKEALGIEGFPVERGLYCTVLQQAGLHCARADGTYAFSAPSNTKIGRTYRPAWDFANGVFTSNASPVSLDTLYHLWEAPPFGIRRGVMPVLALAFILANRDHLAIYGGGRFQPDIDDYLVDVLLQDEKFVALRRIEVEGLRTEILHGIAGAIAAATGEPCPGGPLAVARRLVKYTTELPQWTQKTQRLPPKAAELRQVLLHADDPHKALFVDLPAIFGDEDGGISVQGIETALRDLSGAYPQMLNDLARKTLNALGHTDDSDYTGLRKRAGVVADLTGDMRLDAFAARLSSFEGQTEQVEALASFAINRPARDWTDREPDQAALALAEFALRFRHGEALARVKGRRPTSEAVAIIIGTGEIGQEFLEEFEIADHDRPHVDALAQALDKVLLQSGADKSVMLAALAAAGRQTMTGPARKLRKVG